MQLYVSRDGKIIRDHIGRMFLRHKLSVIVFVVVLFGRVVCVGVCFVGLIIVPVLVISIGKSYAFGVILRRIYFEIVLLSVTFRYEISRLLPKVQVFSFVFYMFLYF